MSAIGNAGKFEAAYQPSTSGNANIQPKDPNSFMDTQEKVQAIFGDWFCETAGIGNLMKMPTVSADSLGIEDSGKYLHGQVTVEHLGKHSAVKGIMNGVNGRPFIAVKVVRFDNKRFEIFSYVEVLYKRYTINRDGGRGKLHEHNYVSSLEVSCDDKKSRESVFFNTGLTQDWSQLKNLLDGKIVRTQLMENSGEGGYLKKV